VVSSPSVTVVKKENEEEEQKIEVKKEEESKKEETAGGEGEEKKTSESDDGAETTTVDANGKDVAMEDKKEPVVAPTTVAQIKQEKAGSDVATTIVQDPLHAFALTLGADSLAVKEARQRREEHKRRMEEEKERLREQQELLQQQQEQERQRQIEIQQQLEREKALQKREQMLQQREQMLQQRMLAQQKKAAHSAFDIMDGFEPGVPAGGNKKKKKKPASGRNTPANNDPTPGAAPVPVGTSFHAIPHPQLDDDFEQNLRGIDELGDADDFDFDALLGENIF